MKEKVLLIVDLQKDFCSPEGSLYVKGAESLAEKIAALIPGYDKVIFTLDFHPYRHCSFKEQGGPWPVHCVEYTEGASLPDCVLAACDKSRQEVYYVRKGQDPDMEEYGAFSSSMDLLECLGDHADEVKIDVCGVAGDYCVKETTANVLNLVDPSRIHMLTDCIASIDGGAALQAFIEENELG